MACYSPRDVCVIFHVYDEWALGDRLLRSLLRYNWGDRVVCILDGTSNTEFELSCMRLGELIRGDRLKGEGNGTLWIKRMLEEFLEGDHPYLIKIDPDTLISKQPSIIPDADWFGTLAPNAFPPFAYGGCVGFSRKAVEAVLYSRLLEDPKYKGFNYDRYGKYRHPDEKPRAEQIASTERILRDIFYRLSITPTNWDEVGIGFRDTPDNSNGRYAAIHPVL